MSDACFAAFLVWFITGMLALGALVYHGAYKAGEKRGRRLAERERLTPPPGPSRPNPVVPSP